MTKEYDGTNNNTTTRLARAFCQGRRDKADAYPGAWFNPYVDGTPEWNAHTRGSASWDTPSGTEGPRDNCDIRPNTPL